MTREQFFQALEGKLRGLPEHERRHIVGVYEDLFQKAVESGKDEHEVVKSLGYTHLYGMPPVPADTVPAESGTRAIVASLALGLFNLFLLGPFIGVCAALFALLVAAAALIGTPLWIALGMGMPHGSAEQLPVLYTVLFCDGLGVLVLLGALFLVKWVWRGLTRYVKLNIRLIKGE